MQQTNGAVNWAAFLKKRLHFTNGKIKLIYLTAAVLIGIVLILMAVPERYALTYDPQNPDKNISDYTIYAPKEIVDTVTTEILRQQARDEVPRDRFHVDPNQAESVLADVTAVLDQLKLVVDHGVQISSAAVSENPEAEQPPVPFTFTDAQLQEGLALAPDLDLTIDEVEALYRMNPDAFAASVLQIRNNLYSMIQKNSLSANNYKDAVATLHMALNENLQIQPELLFILADLNIFEPIISAPQYWVIDQDYISEQQEIKANAVEEVRFLQGQTIVAKGDIINRNQYEAIKALGLLTGGTYDYTIYLGLSAITLMGIASLYLLLRLLWPRILTDFKRSILVCLNLVLGIVVSALCIKFLRVYAAPLMLSIMLTTILLGSRAGFSVTVSLSVILAGLTASNSSTSKDEMICIMLIILLSGIATVSFLKTHTQRVRLILCGMIDAVVAAVTLLMYTLMTSSDYLNLWNNVLVVMVAEIAAALIAIGIQPVLEGVFNLATSGKLLELSNPNHPLLRKLLLEAPGTYHHSIIVANLAEAAAEAIDATPLLARTGAYFHDVGKLKRPQYFKENQNDLNPLNEMDPYVAATIVTSHTRDGVELAQKYRLPPEIIQVIAEHHGDTPVMYFYNKALETANGKQVDIADFRYLGPRPSSKEAAIVMLADTTEAAVRSIPNPTPQAIRERIDSLVQGKIDDGQLNECPLTLSELTRICEAFARVLNGVFHERIEYPKTEIPKRGVFGKGDAAATVTASVPESAVPEPAPNPLPSEPVFQEFQAKGEPADPTVPALADKPKREGNWGIWGEPPKDLFSEDSDHHEEGGTT